MLAAVLLASGCGSAVDKSNPAPANAMVMSKAATTMDTGSPVPVGATVTVADVTPIPDNFNTADGIAQATWVTQPEQDSNGAFRFICGAGQISYDDPIVYPGQPGKSHLHQFYGNLAASASSTYQSLRTTGDSTCSFTGAPVNRSGYWMPAMLDGAGNVVRPDWVAIYYKRPPAGSPSCTPGNLQQEGICVGIPTGLRFVTGYNMQTGTSNTHPFFYCQDALDGSVKAGASTLHDNIAQVVPDCAVGARLTINIGSPDCWDGVNLDSADHRSHMSYGSFVWDAVNNVSVYKCPTDHPYVIPQLTIIANYTVDANFMAGKWHLSSDEMVPGIVPGGTMHADYFEAWSPTVRDTWLANCIDRHLNCAGGDLGNGTVIKGQTVPTAVPRYIALSSIPGGSSVVVATNTTTVPVVTSPTPVPSSSTSTSTGTTTSTTTAPNTTTTTTTTPTTTTTTSTGTSPPPPSTTTTTTTSPSPTCQGKGKKRCVAS